MAVFNFPNKEERERGPSRLERTVETLRELITDIQTDGSGRIVRFGTETKILSTTTAEIIVNGVTESNNTVGLGLSELQFICDHLNTQLTTDARPFLVSVLETPSLLPSTIDDDFTQNTVFSLQITAQP